jgi:hypothetical protein
MTTATLFAPHVRFTSTGESDYEAMMTWRADLEMRYLDEHGDEGDTPDVVAGYAEFAVPRSLIVDAPRTRPPRRCLAASETG